MGRIFLYVYVQDLKSSMSDSDLDIAETNLWASIQMAEIPTGGLRRRLRGLLLYNRTDCALSFPITQVNLNLPARNGTVSLSTHFK